MSILPFFSGCRNTSSNWPKTVSRHTSFSSVNIEYDVFKIQGGPIMSTRSVNYQLLCLRGVSKTPPGRQKYDSGMTAAAEPPRATSGAQRKVPELLDTCRVSYYRIKKRGFWSCDSICVKWCHPRHRCVTTKIRCRCTPGMSAHAKAVQILKKKCRQIRLQKRRNSDQ